MSKRPPMFEEIMKHTATMDSDESESLQNEVIGQGHQVIRLNY